MPSVIVISAVIIGLVVSRMVSKQLLLVIYMLPFRFWRAFRILYDELESSFNYELLGGDKRFKSKKSFSTIYEQGRTNIDQRFEQRWNAYIKPIAITHGIVAILAIALLQKASLLFLALYTAVQLLSLAYLRYSKKYDAGYFSVLMVSLLLVDSERA